MEQPHFIFHGVPGLGNHLLLPEPYPYKRRMFYASDTFCRTRKEKFTLLVFYRDAFHHNSLYVQNSLAEGFENSRKRFDDPTAATARHEVDAIFVCERIFEPEEIPRVLEKLRIELRQRDERRILE